MAFSPMSIVSYLTAPRRRLRHVGMESLRADVVAGTTLAVVLLPQAIAFALVAGLPPQAGLIAAIVGSVVGALWGSSVFVHTGPTSAVSLLVLSSIAASSAASPSDMLVVAGVLAVFAGMVQIVLGVARLGLLVNFVSDAVIVGFAAGAGIQIAVSELRYVAGLEISARGLLSRIEAILLGLPNANIAALAIGIGTIACLLLLRWIRPGWPATLIALFLATAIVGGIGPAQLGVDVLGVLPAALPMPQALPLFDSDLIASLATGAIAVAAIGLIQTMAVARSLPTPDGDRIDANQEFVGQGLANVAAGVFSGFAVSGSFSRSAVAAETGARTPMASVISGGLVLLVTLLAGPVGAYLPRAALAGILVIVAVRMVNTKRIRQILRSSVGETAVMVVTGAGTLFLPIDVAVLAGILTALGHYVVRTSQPDVVAVRPDASFRHFVKNSPQDPCTQLAVFDIRGDLYFGATTHVEDVIQAHLDARPSQRFLLLRMQGVHRIDVSGIQMLERRVTERRSVGGDVFFTRVQRPVLRSMIRAQFHEFAGRSRFIASDDAITTLFHHVLDPAVCVYECRNRAFRECQTIPRPDIPLPVIPSLSPGSLGRVGSEINGHSSRHDLPTITPKVLWKQLHGTPPLPLVIDVREPREYRRQHIPGAHHRPFPEIMSDLHAARSAIDRIRSETKPMQNPAVRSGDDRSAHADCPVVFVCQGGRRSRTVVQALLETGRSGERPELVVLDGGMLAWEAAHLLTATAPVK